MRPDPARAADLGVSTEAIAETVRVAPGRLRAAAAAARPRPAPGADQCACPKRPRATSTCCASSPCPAPAAGCRCAGGDAGDRQRSGPDRPPRPAAQRQLRDQLDGQALGAVQRRVAQLPTWRDCRPASPAPTSAEPRPRTRAAAASCWRWAPAWPASTWCWCCCSAPGCSHDHPRRAGAVDPRRDPGAGDRPPPEPAGDDRHGDADGHRQQELDPAGGVRDRGAARPRPVAARCPARRLQARPAHRDDHAGDGRRRTDRARLRRGPLVPRPDGDRRHRRPGHLDRAQPARHPRALHLRRRPCQPPPPPTGAAPHRHPRPCGAAGRDHARLRRAPSATTTPPPPAWGGSSTTPPSDPHPPPPRIHHTTPHHSATKQSANASDGTYGPNRGVIHPANAHPYTAPHCPLAASRHTISAEPA